MKKWQIILLSLFLAGIAAAAAVYLLVYNKPHPDYERAKPEWIITAESLYFSFASDEMAANNKYTGKVILIDGQIADVEQLGAMVIVSFIFHEGLFGGEGVRCTMLEAHHARALDLIPGDIVSIKGLCTGFTGSDVIMEHCSFQ